MTQTVRVEMDVDQSPEAAFGFVLDVENYSRLMPNVNCVSIVDQNGGDRVTHWDTEIEGAPLIWTERDTILPSELRIEFDCIEGDFDVFRGRWEVVATKATGQVHVACELEYSVGIPIIEEIVGHILKRKMIENLEVMLQGLVRGIGGDA
ncbi:MAG: SRPBCC family protein [Polyangiaceae bacterium]|nr:SRPBCC family protein [Polyangiaceae bacterium]